MKLSSRFSFLACVALLWVSSFAVGAPPASYHLLRKYTLGGEGRSDYLAFDGATRRVFIAHNTSVVVIEADSGKQVGEIPGVPVSHGTAFAPEFGRGFSTSGEASEVTIFDLKTLKVLDRVKSTGSGSDAVAYDAFSHHVFVFNGRSADTTVLDAETGNVVGTISLGGKPEFPQVDGKGHLYDGLEDKSELVRLDTKNLKVTDRWPLNPCEGPSGMAMDRIHARLFIGCDNKMMAIVDANTGKVIATPAIGAGVDANAFDSATGFAFASNGQAATLTIVHEDSPSKFTVVGNVPTQLGARTMALDPKTHNVFLVTADFGPTPAPTADVPKPRPTIIPGTFTLLIFGR